MRRVFSLPALLVLLSCFAAPIAAAQTWHPIAAAKTPGSSLFLLTSEGQVVALNLTASSGSVVGHFAFHILGNPVDMTMGTFNSQPALFIASNNVVSGVPQGRIVAFTTEGRRIADWPFQGLVGGLTFDIPSQTLYFSSGSEPDVYQLSPQPGARPQRVASVSGAQKLGPLAIGPKHERLFLSDAQGDIYFMGIAGSAHRVGPLGHTRVPQAVLVSPSAQVLYIADSGTGQIVALPAGPKMPAVSPNFTPPGSFPNPSGLAWLDPAHLIVADQRNGSVYIVDLSGKIVATIPLSQ